jgi:hypothetical protein
LKIGTSAAKQVEEERSIPVILSGAKNLSFLAFIQLNRRKILRSAQNDRMKCFFRSLQSGTRFTEILCWLKPRTAIILLFPKTSCSYLFASSCTPVFHIGSLFSLQFRGVYFFGYCR